jgi:hypothetical protein
MKAKRQIEASLNSVTMLDGAGGHVSPGMDSNHELDKRFEGSSSNAFMQAEFT